VIKSRWIVWLMIIMILSTSVGFAGQRDPEEIEYKLDSRLQLIRSMECGPDSHCHFGNVVYLQNGNIAAAISETINEIAETHLAVYNRDGDLVQEAVGGDTSGCYGPIFVFQTMDGTLYTTDGSDLLKPDVAWEELLNLGSLVDGESESESPNAGISGVFHVRENEIGALLFWNETQYPIFLDYGEVLDMSDLHTSKRIELEEEELEAALPSEFRLTDFFGFDYGESKDVVYFLVGAGKEITEAYYVLEASKSVELIEGEKHIRLSREGWTKLAIPDNMKIARFSENFAVSGQGFDVVLDEFSELKERSSRSIDSELVRFSYKGDLLDRVQVPGGICFFDSAGNQSVIVSWSGPKYGNALYLMNWKNSSSGSPKRLIAERTRNGKTLARFRDNGYGLLKTEDKESGSVDYLAPLKTNARDVRLQIPLSDLLSKQGETTRDLVILYGEERIRIPMMQLDCRELLATMPCQEEATIEIRLNKELNETIKVEIDLFVVEQVDAMTKCVHRVEIKE